MGGEGVERIEGEVREAGGAERETGRGGIGGGGGEGS